MQHWIQVAAGLSLVLCTACPGSLEDPARFEGQGGGSSTSNASSGGGSSSSGGGSSASASCDAPTMVFAVSCALADCHSGAAPAGPGLDLTPNAGLIGRVLGAKSMESPTTSYIVDPSGSLMTSDLYIKLLANPPYGTAMPYPGTVLLPNDQVMCVAEWIMTIAASGATSGSGSSDAGASE